MESELQTSLISIPKKIMELSSGTSPRAISKTVEYNSDQEYPTCISQKSFMFDQPAFLL